MFLLLLSVTRNLALTIKHLISAGEVMLFPKKKMNSTRNDEENKLMPQMHSHQFLEKNSLPQPPNLTLGSFMRVCNADGSTLSSQVVLNRCHSFAMHYCKQNQNQNRFQMNEGT